MPKSIGEITAITNEGAQLVPYFEKSDYLAITAQVISGQVTSKFNVIHVDSGLALGHSFRKYGNAKKFYDDLLAQVPHEDMVDDSWKEKESWKLVRQLYDAAQEADKPAPAKKLREKAKTRRLDDHGNYTTRWWQLMPFDVPRWLRIYDNGGETADRYTAVYSGLKMYAKGYGSVHPYVNMSSNPFHPQGVGMHGETYVSPIDDPFTKGARSALGKRIPLADLPIPCQALVLQDYCDYWHLDHHDHPAWNHKEGCFFGSMMWGSVEPQWRPMRPLGGRGDGDSRSMFRASDELSTLSPDSIHTWLLLSGYDAVPSEDVIATWDWADKRDVREWAVRVHLAASDNPVKVPDLPKVLTEMVASQGIRIPQQQQGD